MRQGFGSDVCEALKCKKMKWNKFRPFIKRRRTSNEERKNKLKRNTRKLKYFSDDTLGISNPNDNDLILA